MFDVTTGQATQVAQHDAPIKVVGWVDAPQTGILATGSWDKTIKVRACSSFANLFSSKAILSIGICALPTLLPQSNCQRDAIPLTYNTHLWWLEPQNVISRFSISPIPTQHIRCACFLKALALSPYYLYLDHTIAFEVADPCRLVLYNFPSQQWLRCWKCGGTSGHSVSKEVTSCLLHC